MTDTKDKAMMRETKMNPFADKLWAIVGPRGKVHRLATSRHVALSQYCLHYSGKKEKRALMVLSAKDYPRAKSHMKRRGWSVQKCWMIVKPRRN